MPLWVLDSSKSGDAIFGHGITLTLQIEPEVVKLNGVEIKLKDLKARSDFYAVSRFVFPFYRTSNNPNDIISPNNGFNILGFTEQTSLQAVEISNIFKHQYPVQVFFSPDTENFMDAIWMVTVDKDCGLKSNIEAEKVLEPGVHAAKGFRRKLYTPRPFVHGTDTIKPDEVATLKFEYRDYCSVFKPCSFKSYIKSDAGYLPKNVVQVTDGHAEVKVHALGLTSGDTMTIKFGIDKVYSNAVQHTLTVI